MPATPPSSREPPGSVPAGASVPEIGLFAVGLLLCLALSLFAGWGGRDAGLHVGLWLPAVGVGLAFTFWYGWRFPAVLAGMLTLTAIARFTVGQQALPVLIEAIGTALVLATAIAGARWLYLTMGKTSPRFDDPRSAVLYLIFVPTLVAMVAAVADVAVGSLVRSDAGAWAAPPLASLVGAAWIAHMLGFLVVPPFLLVVVGPFLEHYGLIPGLNNKALLRRTPSLGEFVELLGLTFGNSLLAVIQVRLHLFLHDNAWPLWGMSLLLVVWASLRQGLRGGATTSFAGSLVALSLATELGMTPADFSPLQGNLLAQCAVALLVGSSVGWIRATEARYRHVVGHIPLVLTSVRLHHGITLRPEGVPEESPPLTGGRESLPDRRGGAAILREAELVLVSSAASKVLGVSPDSLLGPFSLWLDLVHPDDRPIIMASITQLGLQRQSVACEYRIVRSPAPATNNGALPPAPPPCWVRDTLSPHYTTDGLLDGWDGVVEEISEQRSLQQDNRRIAGMLQALVANMPTGVFFVQGPGGQPIFVNARARQLLGQREDMAAGLLHISHVYRLHRQDGTEYPVDELPVVKALRYGQTCTANDIIVHRPDGRRVPLFTWAAPVDLGKLGQPEAAVWVFEDLSALQQAEFARRETEARLRAVFETLAEGVIVQNKAGVIIEGNPSAAAILGVSIDQLVGRSWLGPDRGCLREDGTPCPADQQPDRLAMQIKLPVRNVVLGVPSSGEIRWLMVNAMPLPVGNTFGPNTKGAQLVTTFADVSQERLAQRAVGAAKEKYQALVESLPVMVLQLDPAGRVVFTNPTAQEMLGGTTGDLAEPGLFEALVDAADRPRVSIALQEASFRKESRFEFGFHSRGGEARVGLALITPLQSDGKFSGSTWIVVDMTRQRRLEEELARAQRMELVGRLASGSVHDFNNMLTGIMGAAGVMRLDLAEGQDVLGHIDLIESTAEHASQLASQIVSLGKAPGTPEVAVDVSASVRATVALVKNMVAGKISLMGCLADEPLPVVADDLQLKQIVLNLCLNARDAMPSGGAMTVSTRRRQGDGRDWAVISVADTGHGMPPHVREKMFEPFFTTKEQGAGIGLSVVRDIVLRLGGSIDVETKEGEGTRIEIGLRIKG